MRSPQSLPCGIIPWAHEYVTSRANDPSYYRGFLKITHSSAHHSMHGAFVVTGNTAVSKTDTHLCSWSLHSSEDTFWWIISILQRRLMLPLSHFLVFCDHNLWSSTVQARTIGLVSSTRCYHVHQKYVYLYTHAFVKTVRWVLFFFLTFIRLDSIQWRSQVTGFLSNLICI